MSHAIIYTDGGARGNPGPAGIGVVIKISGKIHNYKEYIGPATNNQAEYRAVLLALAQAKTLGVETIDFYMDSELICEQLNRRYQVKDQELAKLFLQAHNLVQSFKKVTYRHVRREDNKEADLLVNEVIDAGLKK